MVTVVLAAFALTSCAAVTDGASQPEQASPAPSAANAPVEMSWTSLEEAGTGSAVILFARPDDRARYLNVTFTCTEGSSRVQLREDPRVSMAGECGSGQGYQMTLPPELDEFHLDITLDPAASFELRGRFSEQ
ncbi:MAG TPA: hypothetical protein VF156_02975 [Agromyces sp.]